MGKRLEIKSGDPFGKWTVLEETEPRIHANGVACRMFKCRCECGVVRLVDAYSLKSGHSSSCGCYARECRREQSIKHGLFHEYRDLCRLRTTIIQRCTNPKSPFYKYYGARGIKVCDEWVNSTASFVEWALLNGYRKGLEIDRENTDGDYTPDNCRFVSHQANMNNRRCTRRDGDGIPLRDVYNKAQAPAVSYNCFAYRVSAGWDVNEALKTPARHKGVK